MTARWKRRSEQSCRKPCSATNGRALGLDRRRRRSLVETAPERYLVDAEDDDREQDHADERRRQERRLERVRELCAQRRREALDGLALEIDARRKPLVDDRAHERDAERRPDRPRELRQ